MTLTVNGDPIADIVPHGRRERWLSGAWLNEQLAQRVAGSDLTRDLDELAGQTIGDV